MASLVRRKPPFRRRRRRVDMQTFRLCENEIDLQPTAWLADCNDPLIHMVKVLDAGQEVDRARRSVLFAGGHLRVRLNSAIIDHNDCPCSHPLHVVLALVKLPLLEDTLTPAYLPNLVVTRTFNSVVAATNADNDEDILWWHDEQMDLLNLSCTSASQGCENSGTDCTGGPDGGEFQSKFVKTVAHASALYGRMHVDKRIAVRRRIREREALFLYVGLFSALGSVFNDCPTWPVRLNAYLRYAVR